MEKREQFSIRKTHLGEVDRYIFDNRIGIR